jgi:hypothetical protein
MTETNHGGTVLTGSLLSLVPRQERPPKALEPGRAEPQDAAAPSNPSKPVLSPMLSALARAPEPAANRPAPMTEESESAKSADTATPPADSGENVPVPVPVPAPAPAPAEAVSPEAPVFDSPLKQDAPAKIIDPEPLQSETANGLVARLRRQFMEGLPEGREEERREGEEREEVPGSPTEPTASHPAVETRRSALEEVRFRLREFRAELLARAGRG